MSISDIHHTTHCAAVVVKYRLYIPLAPVATAMVIRVIPIALNP